MAGPVGLAALTCAWNSRYNVCIMAYGQTGSGKSYTMLGPHAAVGPVPPPHRHNDLGLVPRAAEELFRYLGWQ